MYLLSLFLLYAMHHPERLQTHADPLLGTPTRCISHLSIVLSIVTCTTCIVWALCAFWGGITGGSPPLLVVATAMERWGTMRSRAVPTPNAPQPGTAGPMRSAGCSQEVSTVKELSHRPPAMASSGLPTQGPWLRVLATGFGPILLLGLWALKALWKHTSPPLSDLVVHDPLPPIPVPESIAMLSTTGESRPRPASALASRATATPDAPTPGTGSRDVGAQGMSSAQVRSGRTVVKVMAVVGDAPSGFSDRGLSGRVQGDLNPRVAPWEEVLEHMGRKVQWEAEENGYWGVQWCVQREEDYLAHAPEADMMLGFGLRNDQWDEVLDTGRDALPPVRAFFDCCQSAQALTKLGVFESTAFLVALQALLFPGEPRDDKSVYDLVCTLFDRRTAEDLFYGILVIINAYCVSIPFVGTTLASDAETQKRMFANCKDQILGCAKSADCRRCLSCLSGCAQNDQVCSYRCITSYENDEFAQFALCVLQRNNLLGLDAQIPQFPSVAAMQTFRQVSRTLGPYVRVLHRHPYPYPDPCVELNQS